MRCQTCLFTNVFCFICSSSQNKGKGINHTKIILAFKQDHINVLSQLLELLLKIDKHQCVSNLQRSLN